jgi:hypothetical protein
MHRLSRIIATIAAVLLVGGLATPAVAEDKPPLKKELPGVTAPDPIVKPKQESTEKPSASDYGEGFVKMGNWDVKISGYTRVDIRSGNVPNSGR